MRIITTLIIFIFMTPAHFFAQDDDSYGQKVRKMLELSFLSERNFVSIPQDLRAYLW